MNLPDRLVWVDIETTGLDPVKDRILEVAVVITDNRLVELGMGHWVVRPDGLALDAFLVKMHTTNGLLGDLKHAAALADVDVMAAGLVRVSGAAGGPICGSSPHFDLSFLRLHMPLLARCFNHRCFDVSTLKLGHLIELGPSLVKAQEEKADTAHRALADIRYSIACARELVGLE